MQLRFILKVETLLNNAFKISSYQKEVGRMQTSLNKFCFNVVQSSAQK